MLRSAAPGRKRRAAENGNSININTNSSMGDQRSTLRENYSQLTVNNSQMDVEAANSIPKVPGRVVGVELHDFMCHKNLKLDFDIESNCYYIVGPNGSGKSAIFSAINIGLGGKGRSNDRGNSLKAYIREGQSVAKIRVTLINEGPNQVKEYDKYIIVERTIRETHTTYTLRTRSDRGHERVVSTKKADLDRILHNFHIDLENPLSWLSQDRSRQFLQQMKPDKLYNIFEIATDLRATEKLYEQTHEFKSEAKTHTSVKESEKEQMQRNYDKAKERYKATLQIEELRRKRKRVQWQRHWANVRDVDEKIRLEKEKLKKLVEKKLEFENQLKQCRAKKEEMSKERDELTSKVQSIRNEVMEANQMQNEQKVLLSTNARKIRDEKEAVAQKVQEIRAVEREIQQTQEQLNRLMGNASRDLRDEEKRLLDQKNEIEAGLQHLADEERALFDSAERSEKLSFERTRAHNQANYELNELHDQLRKIESDKQLCDATRLDKLALFGRDIPKILQMLGKERRRFQRTPLGPIGRHIKLVDTKWAKPVEYILRGVMNNFICHCAADRKLIEQLCREKGLELPSVIVTPFVDQPVSTVQNEPDARYMTILRTLKIENATVNNYVVDRLEVENLLLMEDDEEARRLIRDRPPRNVRLAVTLECSQVNPQTHNKPYRYVRETMFEPRFFTTGNAELNSRDFTAEASAVKSRIPVQEAAVEKTRKEKEEAESEALRMRHKKRELTEKKTALEAKLKDLDDEYQELQRLIKSATLIENFKATLDENVRSREALKVELDEAKRQLEDYERERTGIELELNEAQHNVNKHKEQMTRVENSVTKILKRMEEISDEEAMSNSKFQKCDPLRQKIEERTETLNIEKAQFLRAYEAAAEELSQPDNMDDPPDFSALPPTNVLDNHLKEYEKLIRASEEASTQNPITSEQLIKMREEYRIVSNKLKHFKNLLKRFDDQVDKRETNFNLLKFTLPERLNKAFEKHMFLRNYIGSLEVNHETKTIVLHVQTRQRGSDAFNEDDDDCGTEDADGNDDEEEDDGGIPLFRGSGRKRALPAAAPRSQLQKSRRAMQDLKGLSGGERSYTTACFVMSLWECVDSPFRCLDEFDVFMDMLNRKVVMELLIGLALQHRENQFFFFTPQGVSEIQGRDNIQIFNMPKVRNN